MDQRIMVVTHYVTLGLGENLCSRLAWLGLNNGRLVASHCSIPSNLIALVGWTITHDENPCGGLSDWTRRRWHSRVPFLKGFVGED
jgi:hypothetical protein